MLRHPFFGIVPALEQPPALCPEPQSPSSAASDRRRFLTQALAAAAGGAALLIERTAAAQFGAGPTVPGNSGSLTESGNSGAPAIAPSSDETVTTQALGEEGGTVTTQAAGEEGGRGVPSRRRDIVTTQAVGEEGSRGWYPRGSRRWYPGYPPPTSPPPGTVTTYALGEEGSYPWPPVVRPPINSPPRYTTFALGEEGGGYYRRY